MPTSVIKRAGEILTSLEKSYRGDGMGDISSSIATAPEAMQLSMFKLDDPVLIEIRDQIKGLDLDSLTPLEALNKLAQIKKISGL